VRVLGVNSTKSILSLSLHSLQYRLATTIMHRRSANDTFQRPSEIFRCNSLTAIRPLGRGLSRLVTNCWRWICYRHQLLTMANQPPVTRFECSNCGAHYRLVRVEAGAGTTSREITCRSCGAPLQAREGRYILKYRSTKNTGARRPSPVDR